MKSPPIDAADDIEKIARNLLRTSKAWGKFPTPVDQIMMSADLTLEKGIDLSKVEPGFFSSSFDFLAKGLSKILGLVDLRHNTIYIDQSQKEPRKNFVTLHEVGHKVIPWQRDILGRGDDEATLDPDFKELCEREASFLLLPRYSNSNAFRTKPQSCRSELTRPGRWPVSLGLPNMPLFADMLNALPKGVRCWCLTHRRRMGIIQQPFGIIFNPPPLPMNLVTFRGRRRDADWNTLLFAICSARGASTKTAHSPC